MSDRLSDCGNENDCNFDDFQRYDDFVPESDFDTLAPEDLPPFDIDPAPPMSAPSARPKTPAENVSPVFSPAPAQDDGGDEWADILKVCKKQVDISTYTFLSDPVHCTGIVNNNNVTVYANNPFALNMIDTPNVTKQIKDAAQQVLGRQVSVRVSDEPAPVKKTTAKNDKLDALGKFGVVFE